MRPFFAAALVLLLSQLGASGCGYRFINPVGIRSYSLASVRNATAEPRLEAILSEAIERVSGIGRGGGSSVEVAVTEFSEKAESISSAGIPVRQKITMEFSWRVPGRGDRESFFGTDTISRTYPYTTDAINLSWARRSAVKLLAEDAAALLSERLEALP